MNIVDANVVHTRRRETQKEQKKYLLCIGYN
jgi:hypothetical protein